MSVIKNMTSLKVSGDGWGSAGYNHEPEKLFGEFRERILNNITSENLLQLPLNELREKIKNEIQAIIIAEKLIISGEDKNRLVKFILNETLGYGPLEELLKDEKITEIMVNGPKETFIEKEGVVCQCDISFRDHEHIRHIIERIVAPIGRRIDDSSPMVDGRLPDGSRVNAVIPPVSIKGPVICIRKFNKEPLNMDNLVEFGTLSENMACFLMAAVGARLNIIISGGTGSGKTTLLNVLCSVIPENERIVTIEDMAELNLQRPNAVSLEARPSNMEGKGEITIRQLVRNALRMRPDRIIVGEVRGGETMDMLQAMNTGHAGSLTTIHANSPADALARLEAMAVMGNQSLSIEVVRSYAFSALDLIIQIERLPDGNRKITGITEICRNSGQEMLQDIFFYHRLGKETDGTVRGSFIAAGDVPCCFNRIKNYGQDLPKSIFY